MDGSDTKYSKLNRVQTGDLVVNKIWARNGSVAVVPDALGGCYVSGEFPTFSSLPDRVDSRWLHWLTKTKPFWEQCDEKSRGTSGKNRIRPEQFLSIVVPLPPIAEQQRIVGRINSITQSTGQLFTLRAEAAKETETLGRAVVESVYVELASGYGLSTVEQVCHSVTDGDHQTPPFSDEGIKFIFVGNASSGRFHFANCKYVTPEYFSNLKPQRVPKRGDILYTAVGATLGVAAVVDTDEPFCFQRHVAILKPDRSRIESRFMWHMLRSQTVFRKAWASTTGSAQPTVPLRAIKQLPIPVAPLSEQRKAVGRLDEFQGRLNRLTEHQTSTRMEIEALLPSVLNMAFHGEL
jgi:type I restriction enzyme S subunit